VEALFVGQIIRYLSTMWGYNFSTFSSVVLWCANIFLKLVQNFFLSMFMPVEKNKLKIMIIIFKNLLAYPTLVVWSLITMINIKLISL